MSAGIMLSYDHEGKIEQSDLKLGKSTLERDVWHLKGNYSGSVEG